MMPKYLANNLFLALLTTLFLTGCSAITGTTPTPLPTIALDNTSSATSVLPQATGSGVAASGVIVPAKEANMAFASGGIVESIEVVIGAHVDAGQVIARLAGAEQLQASLSTAELEILVAQQNLEKLTTDLPEEQIAALQTLNDARKALRDAELKISGFGVPAEQIDVEVARSNVALAKRALDQALKDFQPYENKLESNLKRAALLSKLSDAQKLYDNAVQQLNRLTGVFVPEFDMSQAQTELEIAQTRLTLAEDKYAQLAEGPDPAELELAEARLQNAQDRAQAVRANLANLELKAPFAGVVSQINIQAGEWVIPGQSILALADLDHLRVETTDLSERDIPNVEIGQSVTVQVTALDQEVSGQVTEISPLADTLGGDVVYKTMIDLDTIPSDLRAGMSVEVQFGVTQ
jgi:HlyD family secretion protein